MAASAMKKQAIDIGMVFGMPKKGDPDAADEGGEAAGARDTLKHASGWDDDTLDALEDFVMAHARMASKSKKKSAGDDAGMDDSGRDYEAEQEE